MKKKMNEQYIKPELLHIPRGYFWMGSHERDTNAWDVENPYHRMDLGDYWID